MHSLTANTACLPDSALVTGVSSRTRPCATGSVPPSASARSNARAVSNTSIAVARCSALTSAITARQRGSSHSRLPKALRSAP